MFQTRADTVSAKPSRSCLFVCLFFLLCCGGQARGLDPSKSVLQYAHRTWGLEEGLLQPTVYSILQTRDGFLWLGTQDSLIRFDGIHFRELDYRNSAPLHGALVRSLLQDRAGNLWAGTIGNGLYVLTPDGVLKHLAASSQLPSNNVFCLDTGSDGSVWACTEKGILRGTAKGGFTVANTVPARATCETADGTRWIAGLSAGLATTEDGSPLQAVSGIDGLVNALLCARDGTVWAGTSSGLVHFGAEHQTRITTREGLPDNTVNSLVETSDGSLWVGTDEGISRWRDGELSVYSVKDGLSHSVVLSLFSDREGTLWAGTKGGLDQFTNPKLTPYTTAEGLSSNDAGPVLEDQHGRLWVGTLGAGLNLYQNGKFRHIGTVDGLPSNRVFCIAARTANQVWAGTDRGLAELDNDHVARVALAGQSVQSLFVDRLGALWIGTEHNLYRYDGRSFVPVGSAPNGVMIFPGLNQSAFLVNGDGSQFADQQQSALAAYAATGLIRPISSTYPDNAHGTVWLGTLGSGLLRWRASDSSMVRIHVKDGLYDGRIYGIVADQHANLWFSSSKGIFRVAEQELEEFADGKRKAVTSVPFTTGQLRFECRGGVQPAASRSADGRLWFSTTNGVAVVDPSRLQSNNTPPPVRITAVIVDGERHAPAASMGRLGPGQHNLEIRYAGLSFVSPEKVEFKYILDGYDTRWTDAGARREAFFTNLPPRTFHFRVIARNADGVWSRDSASFDFSIEPRLYQRWWFYVVLVGFGTATAFAFYRRRILRIQHGYELVLAERSRIARELHDTLLQGLSGVTMQLQALWMKMPVSRNKQMLEEIIQDAAHCSTEARQSLWNLRPQTTRSERLSDKLTDLAHEVVGHTPLSLELEIQPLTLLEKPELEFQMLRIAREALSNAVRHSRASKVTVGLSSDQGKIELVVHDNGLGFDPEIAYAQAGHFGLLGMKERAAEIAAELIVQSSLDAGTVLTLRVPAVHSSREALHSETHWLHPST